MAEESNPSFISIFPFELSDVQTMQNRNRTTREFRTKSLIFTIFLKKISDRFSPKIIICSHRAPLLTILQFTAIFLPSSPFWSDKTTHYFERKIFQIDTFWVLPLNFFFLKNDILWSFWISKLSFHRLVLFYCRTRRLFQMRIKSAWSHKTEVKCSQFNIAISSIFVARIGALLPFSVPFFSLSCAPFWLISAPSDCLPLDW